jgi:glucose-6-phosphate 1-dehydrogenase
LAKKSIYPTLWKIYRDDLAPRGNLFILGYARSQIDIQDYLRNKIYDKFEVQTNEESKFSEFVAINHYISGSYDDERHFKELNKTILDLFKSRYCQKDSECLDCERIYYFALPPFVYKSVAELLSLNCRAQK